jgi:hypothetical protein
MHIRVVLAVQWVSNLLHNHPVVLVCTVFLDIYLKVAATAVRPYDLHPSAAAMNWPLFCDELVIFLLGLFQQCGRRVLPLPSVGAATHENIRSATEKVGSYVDVSLHVVNVYSCRGNEVVCSMHHAR